jgi:transcription-repair coupling factor (superfamily II helicase)
MLVVAADTQTAEGVYEDFITLTSEEDCAFFPPWETLPTDIIDPAEDIVSERLNLLTRIVSGYKSLKLSLPQYAHFCRLSHLVNHWKVRNYM